MSRCMFLCMFRTQNQRDDIMSQMSLLFYLNVTKQILNILVIFTETGKIG